MSDRPKVEGYRKHTGLTENQHLILRLVLSALTGNAVMRNTPGISVSFARHTAKGGWVYWLTIKNYPEESSRLLGKIRHLRRIVEEEKQRSGLCRVFLIPMTNDTDGWEGFKVRTDRGERLVYEEV